MRCRLACACRFTACCLPIALLAAATASPLLTRHVSASELRRTATVRVVESARPSVVNIRGEKTLAPDDEGYRPGEGPQRVKGMGTGVIIDERGYIITNHHVVEGVRRILVTLASEKTYTATLVSHDARTDLAVIRIQTSEKLPVVNIGTSSDLMPGEPVIAVGNAYGYEHTVTCGIISALHRTVQVSDTQNYQDLIQTDASINPGNSGGPLLNIDGEMIGINVAVRAGAQGIGFAIPVDVALQVAARLMSTERLSKTWHGVVAQDAAPRKQLVVESVQDDSPAAKSGLKPGDVITDVANVHIARRLDFERALLGRKVGDAVTVTVRRDSESIRTKLVLAATRKQSKNANDQAWEMIGLKLDPVPPDEFPQNQTHYQGGLLVTDVRPDSPGAQQGIRRGDILVGMHIWETIKLGDVSYVLNRPEFKNITPLKFYILRGSETLYGYVTVSLENQSTTRQ